MARLKALIEGGCQLPNGAQVHPYAEEAFKSEGLETKVLLEMIAQLDKILA
ncbi:YqcC family protein [Reinekea sp.]|uniref:YqcC family protein n=1 Tax=Reinekea sp. TaxID=1970455 RepID=UPI00398A14DF